MYELSHGSQPSKRGSNSVLFAAIGLVITFCYSAPVYVRILATLGLILYYGIPKNEPKQNIEPKLILEPQYRLTQLDAIALLRNAQVEKRGK